MTIDERAVQEIGKAVLRAIIAESKLEEANAKIEAQAEQIAKLKPAPDIAPQKTQG